MKKIITSTAVLILFPLWIAGIAAAILTQSVTGTARWNDNDDRKYL